MNDEVGNRRPLPAVPNPDDPDFNEKLHTFLDQLVGGGLDSIPTRRELFDAGIADIYEDGQRLTATGVFDPTGGLVLVGGLRDQSAAPPSQPTHVLVQAATVNIVIEWDSPTFVGYAFTEIWRSATNNRGTAIRIGTSVAAGYADAVGEQSQTYYYWVRHVNTAAMPGAFHAGPNSGQSGTTTPGGGGEGGTGQVLVFHKIWRFANTLAGWIPVSQVTFTPSPDYLIWDDVGPTGYGRVYFSLNGASYSIIEIRMRRVEGGTWKGKLQYETPQHSFQNAYHIRFPDPGYEWTSVFLDMSQLTSGGDDWVTSTITGLQLFLGDGADSKFQIEYIGIGRGSESIVSIDGGVIVDSTIVNAKFVNGTIEGAKIANSTITGAHIAANTISADKYLELRNSQIVNFADPVDDTHPLIVDFPVSSELAAGGIQAAKLSYKIRPFRAYSKAGTVIAGGGTFVSEVADTPVVPYHTHVDSLRTTSTYTWPLHFRDDPPRVYGYGGRDGWDQDGRWYFSSSSVHEGSHRLTIGRETQSGHQCYAYNGILYAEHNHSPTVFEIPLPEAAGHAHNIPVHYGGGGYLLYALPDIFNGVQCRLTPEPDPPGLRRVESTGASGTHKHNTIIPDHPHPIDFGIYEETLAANITVHASNDGGQTWTLVGGPSGVDQLELDVKSHFTGAGWKALRFSSDLRCNITGLLELKIDINA